VVPARRVATQELQIAVRTDIRRGEGLLVERERKGQGDGRYAIIAVIAYVERARNYSPTT
jgi:hypothetical protein